MLSATKDQQINLWIKGRWDSTTTTTTAATTTTSTISFVWLSLGLIKFLLRQYQANQNLSTERLSWRTVSA